MLHLWPQGRFVRIGCFVLTGIVAADLAWSGAWANFSARDTAGANANTLLTLGIIYTVLATVALVAGLVLAGFHKRSVQFLIEVEDQMTKVEWVPWDRLWRSTVVIGLAVAVMGAIIFVSDWLLYEQFLKSIFTLGKHF